MSLIKKINIKDLKSSKKNSYKVAVCYIYQKGHSSFWENIDHTFKHFTDIFVINLSQEEFKTNRKNLKVVDVKENEFHNFIGNFFLGKKNLFSHVVLLESSEKILINSKLEFSEDESYNINIVPEKQEIYDYSISPFINFENRIFSLKKRNLKSLLSNFDLYLKSDIQTVNKDIAYIVKGDFNSDFEKLKLKNIDNNSIEIKFFRAVSNFYLDTNLSYNLFIEILEDDTTEEKYKFNSYCLLLKLFLMKEEYLKVEKLFKKYGFIDSNSSYYIGQYYLNKNDYKKALSYFNHSIKLKKIEDKKDVEYFINQKLVYNLSDITFKLYKSLGTFFYDLKRYKSAEKYFNIAIEFLKDQYSPEVSLYLARIKFNAEDYEETFKLFNQIINNADTPKKILKDLKQPLINLMLFLSYREEFNDILAKPFIDHQDDILRVADTYYMNGDFINALQLYILAVKRFGFDQKQLFKLGYISSMLRSLDQACYYFEKFLEKDPDNLTALNNLAFIYLSLENGELAEKYYMKIVALNNYSYEANLYLAIIYMSRNEKEKAENFLEKAKILNPTSLEVINLYKIFKKEFA